MGLFIAKRHDRQDAVPKYIDIGAGVGKNECDDFVWREKRHDDAARAPIKDGL